MHPYLTELLAQDRAATFRREAEEAALAKAAKAANQLTPSRRAGLSLMPHIQERRTGLRRVLAMVLSPAIA